MYAAIEEILSHQEMAAMDAVEPSTAARDLLQQINDDSKKLLTEPSPEIGSIIRAGAIFAAKVEYLRKQFFSVYGDLSRLTQEERAWVSDLDSALLKYVQIAIGGLAKVFPHILGSEARKSANCDPEKSERLITPHALIALVLSAHEIENLLMDSPRQVTWLSGIFFHSVFAAQQIFRLHKLKEAAIGGSSDLTNLPQTKRIFNYVTGTTELASKVCEMLNVSLGGRPVITILDEETPPVVCIEYPLDAPPLKVCEANDILAKAIAVNDIQMPNDYHVCFGVA